MIPARKNQKQSRKIKKILRGKENIEEVIAWVRREYELLDSGSIAKSEVYKHYRRTCKRENRAPTTCSVFGKIVRLTFPNIKCARKGPRGNSRHHYKNLHRRQNVSTSCISALSSLEPASFAPPVSYLEELIKKEQMYAPEPKWHHSSHDQDKSNRLFYTDFDAPTQFPQQPRLLPPVKLEPQLVPKTEPLELSDVPSENDLVPFPLHLNQLSPEMISDAISFAMEYKLFYQELTNFTMKMELGLLKSTIDKFWARLQKYNTGIFLAPSMISQIVNIDKRCHEYLTSLLIDSQRGAKDESFLFSLQQYIHCVPRWLSEAYEAIQLPPQLKSWKQQMDDQFVESLCKHFSITPEQSPPPQPQLPPPKPNGQLEASFFQWLNDYESKIA
eukprot:CAMPEP_0174253376 /NCGR_PEP_ID=MMETSP0439-20130205/2749_1 /TAXON_ID=0 /ORGANISM="Stereomyxa ramosa, Strain Chinc5" /LENGTH=386 /DNA_ID=CAMNT_0015334373 /DNA_START=53 /DNA_END=1209 /DNA_ORIENTATION=-